MANLAFQPGGLVLSRCAYCEHLSADGGLGLLPSCSASPSRISAEVLANEADHRRPIEGDEGMGEPETHVLFSPKSDVPEKALRGLYRLLDALPR